VDQKGETLEEFLLLDCDYLGNMYVRKTRIRVVCKNTLGMARSEGKEFYRINSKNPESHLRIILRDLPDRARAEAAAVREVMSIMQETALAEAQLSGMVAAAFPLPRQPKPTGDPVIDAEDQERYNTARDRVVAKRALTREVYAGAGRGMDIEDTLWKGYNAVVETIDWSTDREYKDTAALFNGSRASSKTRAWDYAVDVIRHPEEVPA